MSNGQKLENSAVESGLEMEIKEAMDFLCQQCSDGVISDAQRDEAIDYIRDLK